MYEWDWNKERNKKHFCLAPKEPKYSNCNLKFTDPGDLVGLLSELWHQTSPPLEIKINKFFQTASDAKLSFFLHSPLSLNKIVVQVLGEKELATPLMISRDSEFMARIKKMNGPLLTENPEHIDETLLYEIKKKLRVLHTEDFKNFLILPVRLGHSKWISYYFAFVNFFGSIMNIENLINHSVELLRFCGAIVANTFACDVERRHVLMNEKVILSTTAVIPKMGQPGALASAMRSEACRTLKGEAGALYFFNKPEGAACRVMNFQRKTRSKQAEADYTETPFETPVSVPKLVVSTDDPLPSYFFLRKTPQTGAFKVRSLFSFPLVCNDDTNGIIEIYNRRETAGDSFEPPHIYGECFSTLFGYAVDMCLKIKTKRKETTRWNLMGALLSRRVEAWQYKVNDVLYCENLHKYANLLDLQFLPTIVPTSHSVCVLMGMVHKMELFGRLGLTEMTLIRFFLNVEDGHTNLPFHNWLHAFSTAHFVFALIHNLSLIKNGKITAIEGFALFIGALVHILDYRGPTNMFQLTCGNSLASLYSSPENVQQCLSYARALEIIAKPECNIVDNFSSQEFLTFAYLLQTAIMETSVDNHIHKIDQLQHRSFEKYTRDDPQLVVYFHSLMMTCADISDYCKEWDYCLDICEQQIKEFFRVGDLSQACGVFDVDDVKNRPKKSVALQIQFVEVICVPAFELMYAEYPTTYPCLKQVQENRDRFKEFAELLDKEASEASEATFQTKE